MSSRALKTSMVVGGIVSLLFFAFVYTQASSTKQWLFALWWPAFALHQVEEYLVAEKVLGKKYFFLEWFNSVGYNVSTTMSFFVNCVLSPILVVVATCIAFYLDGLWLAIPVVLMTIEFANGNWHIALTTHHLRYSPGVITALLIYIPLTVFIYLYFVANRIMGIPLVLASIVGGYLLHFAVFKFVFPKVNDQQ